MSIKISLKLIATLRERLPAGTVGNTCSLDIAKNSSVFDVLNNFDIPKDNVNVVLVNGSVPLNDQILKEGDEVCAFPAIAGGNI